MLSLTILTKGSTLVNFVISNPDNFVPLVKRFAALFHLRGGRVSDGATSIALGLVVPEAVFYPLCMAVKIGTHALVVYKGLAWGPAHPHQLGWEPGP
jgi:hypothetical protein